MGRTYLAETAVQHYVDNLISVHDSAVGLVIGQVTTSSVTHLATHLVWPHRSENPPGRPRARRISPWKKPILVSLILLNEPLKALMLVASTARWSS